MLLFVIRNIRARKFELAGLAIHELAGAGR
jgi:hypothetical protein